MTTRIKSSFPNLDWPDQAIIAVDAGDSSAVITGLVIHLSQDVPEDLLTVPPFVPLFTYGNTQQVKSGVLISDETGGITSEATAGFAFLLSEPTLHAFSPELVEDAVRNTYQADQSGVVYSLVIVGRALKKAELSPTLVPTIAGEMAAVWNENAAVPGVTDIVETQETTALGSLYDVFQVAVESTSGLSTTFLTLTQNQTRPDIFAGIIAAAVKRLDANEVATQMPGPNEPGYNVLTPPATRAHKAWFNFWRSITTYNISRNAQTIKYTQAIKRIR